MQVDVEGGVEAGRGFCASPLAMSERGSEAQSVHLSQLYSFLSPR